MESGNPTFVIYTRQVQMMTGHRDVNSVIRYDRHRSNLDENAINTLDYDEA